MSTVATLSPVIGTGTSAAVDQVLATMADMKAQVDANISRFDGVVSSLLAVSNDSVTFAAPNLDFSLQQPTLQPINTSPVDYGSLMPSPSTAPDIPVVALNLPTAPTIVMPAQPVLDVINVPNSPTMAVISAPAKPVVDTNITIPTAPTISLPIAEALLQIEIPTFTAPVLPTFNETAPLLDAVAPNVSINWVEPTYESENMTEVLEVLSRMRLGGTGLSPGIEQQIFERARSREDRVAAKARVEALDLFAARGFVAPPGALQGQLNMIIENNQLQANTLQRDIMVKIADVQIENLRFSVTQGLAAEQILVNIFNNYAQRTFEIAKYTIESSLAVYNTKVNIFNALMQGYQTKAQVYKTLIDGQLANLEAYKIELDGAKVTSEINTQKIQTYEAQVRALLSNVELYKVQLQGVQTKADIVKTIFDSFRTEIQAYAETIGAEKVKFDAYRAQVDAEQAKAKINDSKASIFSTLVQGEANKVSLWKSMSEVEIERVKQDVNTYSATIDGWKANITAQLGVVQANAETKRVELQARGIENSAVIESNKAMVQVGEMRLQSNLSKANTSIKLYEVNLTKLMQHKAVQTDSLKAAGQMLSTLVGGAMSAQHVSASISTSTSESSSNSQSISNSLSESI